MTDDNHRETSSLLDVLRHVVETLQDAERSGEGRGTGSGTVSGRHTRTDYGFSVSTGPDPDSLWERLGVDEPSDGSDAETTPTSTDDHLVDVREVEDGVVVLADLPQATAESVTAGIDREENDLVIGFEGEVVERIPLGDADITVADSTFRNGVLEVRLRTDPEEGAS
ncbi:gas vesicle protein GvpH [Halalkalicoccus sp. NIPERK01]|uniref:gas vesicle protein GvpH n=1 Tax=Halalkalicoccus sp. NIPERK01 TaxID=3053469 RepID=UPI00256EA3A4|nr:gas vesicle protein GvpH [Halalkalicoccus sp. NIPERK01]MDL5363703.1 gas vesicle protein GvpH [Halalkalicoccus sp. NIPERK01]